MLARTAALVARAPSRLARTLVTIREAPKAGAQGGSYKLTADQIDQFKEKGYVVLPTFLTEAELRPIEELYEKIYAGALSGEVKIPGRDFCDMAGGYDRLPKDYIVPNIMLPRRYMSAFQNNVYEKRSAAVVAQLYADVEMTLDYDQLLNKKPQQKEAVFAMHQDMQYWPPKSVTPDTRTATFSLAVDATTKQNGAIQFVVGSHKEQKLRPFKPFKGSRDEGHALVTEIYPTDKIEYAEVPRGGVSIHEEFVVHGSGGNLTNGPRRTYVIAYRTADTVKRERSFGFDHSHNTKVNWDTFKDMEAKQTKTA